MMPLRYFVFLFVSIVGPLAAQQQYTKTDIENGGLLYLSTCAGCHGPEGDGIAGVQLGRGQFRRASTDAEVVRIIINGIPGTGMPPNTMTEPNAATIVAYLRSLAGSPPSTSVGGDAIRGKAIFEGKGNCLSCHRVNGNGSRIGPDLSDIGGLRRAVELEQSLLDPQALILPNQRLFRVVNRRGDSTTGRLLNHDSFTVLLLDSNGQLLSLPISDLREYGFVNNSPMPSYRDRLSAQELADLVRYLVSLKGSAKP
jgi:putative heme-binding domain-containing protein